MYLIFTDSKEVFELAKGKDAQIFSIFTANESSQSTQYATQEVKNSKDIGEFLIQLGITPNLKGFSYLKETLEQSLTDNNFITKGITTVIYPYIAQICGTTPQRVERSIRHAILRAKSSSTPLFCKIFKAQLNDVNVITNSQFLHTLHYTLTHQ